MIAKRIARETSGNFRRLAEYIAAASDPGEKLDQFWTVNTNTGDAPTDLDMTIHEIEATQALNIRVKGDKSYHLVVSFRDEQPSPEALRDIEQEYAKALGFEDHHRVAATHQNTDNYHLHIAFNKIHPKTARIHTPHRDFRALEKVSRAMEKKHGLKIDPGREDKLEASRKPDAARNMEAHTWEQSFYTYVQGHKKPLLKAVGEAKDWQDLHEAFHTYDLNLKKHGNGLIITNGNRSHQIKASALDRSCSKPALEKRLGPFQPRKRPRERTKSPKPKHYKRRPTTRTSGQGRLWRRYLNTRKGRDSLTTKAIKTWRDFLLYSAIDDPLAMAIIVAQKKVIEGLFALPNAIVASAIKRHSNRVVPKQPKTEPQNLAIPFAQIAAAKKAGAKWNRVQKRWYAPDKNNLGGLKRWITRPVDQDYVDYLYREQKDDAATKAGHDLMAHWVIKYEGQHSKPDTVLSVHKPDRLQQDAEDLEQLLTNMAISPNNRRYPQPNKTKRKDMTVPFPKTEAVGKGHNKGRGRDMEI